ncbi:GlxA family transcriptional regulator [Achromobacter sp. 413638]|uniref:GlxA family transcriptional regulator n=1 Tax=Achromobacter sp. 413638 TaxID=3342385 RepID=UPI00370A200D
MNAPDAQDGAPVRFGIILLPDFTLTAFSGLVDVLRLASDEGDNSRPRRCSWEILGENPQPVRASCGVQIAPWSLFGRPDAYDYLVVVGGLLRATPEISKTTLDFIHAAGGSRTTLVGVCTGAFALMRAGVLDGHRVCVSWFHYWDFLEQFPQADANLLVADRLYVEDRRRITCSGGRASIDVGAAILARHVPPAAVQKALRILQVDEPGRYNAPQPQPHLPGAAPSSHPKVRRAILLMEQHLSQALTVEALAKKLDMSVRQLERLFKEDTGKSPQAYARAMRLGVAAWMLRQSGKTVAAIASACGFSDASHMGREFRQAYGVPPGVYRAGGRQEAATQAAGAAPADGADYAELFPNRSQFY